MSPLAAVLSLPARAEQLSPKAWAALLQVEHTAAMENRNKQGPGARGKQGQVCKGIRRTKDADQDTECCSSLLPLCAGTWKEPAASTFWVPKYHQALLTVTPPHRIGPGSCWEHAGLQGLGVCRAPRAGHLAEAPTQPACQRGERWGSSERRLLGRVEKPVFPGSAVFWDSICQETAGWLSWSILLRAAAALAAPGTAGEAEQASTAARGAHM